MHVTRRLNHQHYIIWQASWHAFCTAYFLFGREADLQRLVTWAERKRLPKPFIAYQNRLIETQTALSRIRVRSPRIWTIACFCFSIADWLYPPPKYMRKGSAAGYRLQVT